MRIPLLLLIGAAFAGCSAALPSEECWVTIEPAVTAVSKGTTDSQVTTDSKVTMFKPGSGESIKIQRSALVGTWYGRQPTQEGTIKEWITRRGEDGEFLVRFRNSRSGRVVEESTEVGEWGLSYDLEVVITRGWLVQGIFQPAPADAYFWDIYRIERVDAAGLSYEQQGTGHRYEVKRVRDNFEFPALGD